MSCNTRIRRFRAKLEGIKLLGGKCSRCGFDHPGALEFHHLGGKDFAIGNAANKSWGVIKAELLKCELVCSNCHRIEHATKYGDEKFMEEAARYKGWPINSKAP